MAADGAAPWVTTESARVAKESLLSYPAVTVPLADQPPVIANRAMLDEAVRPVVRRVADLTQQTIAAAELSARDLAGMYCAGGSARLPRLGEAIAEHTGITPAVVAEPQFVAAFGAAKAGSAGHGVGVAVDVPVPRCVELSESSGSALTTGGRPHTHDARRTTMNMDNKPDCRPQ
ncbi:Hsp70 family protein [Salinispora arenicola]|uniref:Hsp70 family protein n=1 Tax=Salinispora arenicola TaxID=168697 RepID=UPI0027DDEFE6|nr:Hsp70 family protein [Salinispora arenicola]